MIGENSPGRDIHIRLKKEPPLQVKQLPSTGEDWVRLGSGSCAAL